MSETCGQKPFTNQEVLTDWYELMNTAVKCQVGNVETVNIVELEAAEVSS